MRDLRGWRGGDMEEGETRERMQIRRNEMLELFFFVPCRLNVNVQNDAVLVIKN
jgi:hypothetical protein